MTRTRLQYLVFAAAYFAFLLLLLYLDWLKGGVYKIEDHGFWVRVKTLTLIAGSVLLAFGCCGWRRGLLFLITYGLMWTVYVLLGMFSAFLPVGTAGWFASVTLLFTPFPIAIFFIAEPFLKARSQAGS